MNIAEQIQNLIHKLESGKGSRFLWVIVVVLAVVGLVFLYNLRAFQNFSAPEAMDQAQLARNLADGKGYTTLFIRPFSLYLVQTRNEARHVGAPAAVGTDFAKIQTGHPDLANPPAYPVVLAGLMKVLNFQFIKSLKFHYPIQTEKPFWFGRGSGISAT